MRVNAQIMFYASLHSNIRYLGRPRQPLKEQYPCRTNASPWSPGPIKESVFRSQRISWRTASPCWSGRVTSSAVRPRPRRLGRTVTRWENETIPWSRSHAYLIEGIVYGYRATCRNLAFYTTKNLSTGYSEFKGESHV